MYIIILWPFILYAGSGLELTLECGLTLQGNNRSPGSITEGKMPRLYLKLAYHEYPFTFCSEFQIV